MPQLAELSHEDYSKLFNACSRFKQLPCASVFVEYGQDKSIHSVAGLVPFREWRYVIDVVCGVRAISRLLSHFYF